MTGRENGMASRGIASWRAAALSLSAAAVVWCASAPLRNDGPDYMVGPYHLPLWIEWTLGCLAVVGGLAALLYARSETDDHSRAVSAVTSGVWIFTAAFAAILWRMITSGGEGANIGGGIAALVGPLLITLLLFSSVCREVPRKPHLRRFMAWSATTWALAPAMYVVLLKIS